ncbi:ACT domain-containing protein [Patulibacter sp. SYSU D01012]|uniref:ACT domain-containing protein n=1 Tax=Patulibacter sp. SYSU D01012 TaxID=2817381 RepID=UPI001B30112C|nr:ACT domain-containing protein [Patulibacter sp. SYSU D01012]
MTGERDLDRLLTTMEPVARPGVWTFTTLPPGAPVPAGLDPVVTVAEAEGTTLVVPLDAARAAGLPADFAATWITLSVHSALDAVGLTAEVARRLTAAGISCNVVAGYFHDHLFVPRDRADDALRALAG